MERRIDRLVKYMEHKGLNDKQVTEQCLLSNGLIGKARQGRSDIGMKAVDKILNVYLDLNRVWLLTGEGTMLNDNPGRTTPDPPPAKRKGCPSIDEMVERMEEILGMLEQERSAVAEQKKTIAMQEQTIQNERKEKQSLLEIIKHMVGGGYKSGDNMA